MTNNTMSTQALYEIVIFKIVTHLYAAEIKEFQEKAMNLEEMMLAEKNKLFAELAECGSVAEFLKTHHYWASLFPELPEIGKPFTMSIRGQHSKQAEIGKSLEEPVTVRIREHYVGDNIIPFEKYRKKQ